jgi:hypothetical protein
LSKQRFLSEIKLGNVWLCVIKITPLTNCDYWHWNKGILFILASLMPTKEIYQQHSRQIIKGIVSFLELFYNFKSNWRNKFIFAEAIQFQLPCVKRNVWQFVNFFLFILLRTDKCLQAEISHKNRIVRVINGILKKID